MSSTRDSVTKILVEKKLVRKESYQKYSSTQSTPLFSTSPGPSDDVSPSSHSATSTEEYTPKRPCTQSVGTTVEIPKDFLKKLGPAADRLELSNNVLTSVIAAVTNHGGGYIKAALPLKVNSTSPQSSRQHISKETLSVMLAR